MPPFTQRLELEGQVHVDDVQHHDVGKEIEQHQVLFSQDDDMLVEATRRQRTGAPFSGVVPAHQLQTTIGTCVRDLELIVEVADPDDMADHVEYLPL